MDIYIYHDTVFIYLGYDGINRHTNHNLDLKKEINISK